MTHFRTVFRACFRSWLIAVWFMFLTFPLVVIKIDSADETIIWRWKNMFLVGAVAFILSFFWRSVQKRGSVEREEGDSWRVRLLNYLTGHPRQAQALAAVVLITAAVLPFYLSSYQTTILTTALMYVILGLGLNIVVGLAGLLDLGYVAFYAVGAYCYGLLNHYYGLGFWLCLPLSALVAGLFGVILGFPILRLRGDYLAIVTLGFGQIVRLVLENWSKLTQGPSGIDGIDRPAFFGMEMSIQQANIYMYYIVAVLVIITIFIVRRLKNSRIGRAWIALREDEIACQAMGIDKTWTKLSAFALGATWAGLVGCLFAAKNAFISPISFSFMESAIILSIVVLGGMGSIIGVILAAFLLMLLPEYLRAFSDLRMMIFGASMVIIMVFRPQGLISELKQHYKWHKGQDAA